MKDARNQMEKGGANIGDRTYANCPGMPKTYGATHAKAEISSVQGTTS